MVVHRNESELALVNRSDVGGKQNAGEERGFSPSDGVNSVIS